MDSPSVRWRGKWEGVILLWLINLTVTVILAVRLRRCTCVHLWARSMGREGYELAKSKQEGVNYGIRGRLLWIDEAKFVVLLAKGNPRDVDFFVFFKKEMVMPWRGISPLWPTAIVLLVSFPHRTPYSSNSLSIYPDICISTLFYGPPIPF